MRHRVQNDICKILLGNNAFSKKVSSLHWRVRWREDTSGGPPRPWNYSGAGFKNKRMKGLQYPYPVAWGGYRWEHQNYIGCIVIRTFSFWSVQNLQSPEARWSYHEWLRAPWWPMCPQHQPIWRILPWSSREWRLVDFLECVDCCEVFAYVIGFFISDLPSKTANLIQNLKFHMWSQSPQTSHISLRSIPTNQSQPQPILQKKRVYISERSPDPRPTNKIATSTRVYPSTRATHQVTSEGGKSSAKPTSITTASGGSIEHNLEGESCWMFSKPTPKWREELSACTYIYIYVYIYIGLQWYRIYVYIFFCVWACSMDA